MAQIGQQHDELVPTQPRDRIAGAHMVGQPGSNFAKQKIASFMTQRVVDVLEPIQVKKDQRRLLATSPRVHDDLIKSLL